MFKKKILIIAFIMLVLLLSISCTPNKNESLKIQADRDIYTPLMSSTVGIGLTPEYLSKRNLETVKFHWKTNYGYFISWNSPDFKVNMLGAEVINGGEKIYWSYDPNEIGVNKPDVKISLKIEDTKSEKTLAETNLDIIWEDTGTAKVKK